MIDRLWCNCLNPGWFILISYLVLCCSLPRVRSICMQLKKWNSKGVWLFVASSTSYSGAMERRKAPSAQDVQSLGVRHPTSGWPKHSGAKGFHHCHINIFIHCPSLSAFGGKWPCLCILCPMLAAMFWSRLFSWQWGSFCDCSGRHESSAAASLQFNISL